MTTGITTVLCCPSHSCGNVHIGNVCCDSVIGTLQGTREHSRTALQAPQVVGLTLTQRLGDSTCGSPPFTSGNSKSKYSTIFFILCPKNGSVVLTIFFDDTAPDQFIHVIKWADNPTEGGNLKIVSPI